MWRDASKRALAAEALRTNSENVLRLGCVDAVVPEPRGGAQDDPELAIKLLDEVLQRYLSELKQLGTDELVRDRILKFRNMARFFTEG
jgi:acetyl-CoA carboxylase carboxyl transferase subunit alpha